MVRHDIQATLLRLVGDGVFLWNLVLWATVAAAASKFDLIPTLSYSNASEQVTLGAILLSILAP